MLIDVDIYTAETIMLILLIVIRIMIMIIILMITGSFYKEKRLVFVIVDISGTKSKSMGIFQK